ncbi:MAG: ATP synthase F1 subunit gamma [Planctomycetota bacterium]|jgi:F-type H+-transporting ATPase subunit gamma
MAKATNPMAIKRQIRSVQNLKKITKAMEMVSASKLKKVQAGLQAIAPYSDKLKELVQRLQARAGDSIDAPMLQPRDQVKNVGYVVFAADKGLCGSYNGNLLRVADKTFAAQSIPAKVWTVGKKTRQHMAKQGVATERGWEGLPPSVGIKEVREIAGEVIGAYERHEIDEVHVVYSEFINAVRCKAQSVQFLPFDASSLLEEGEEEAGDDASGGADVIFEPDPKTILEQLIPRFVEIRFFRILLDALASEHAARMNAMHNATENADEMVKELKLTYNKVRQASITKELLDIVGGVEALKG